LIAIMDSVVEKRISDAQRCRTDSLPRLDTTTDIISSYNRLIRNQTQSRSIIRSSNPAVSAEEECANVWEDIWNKDSEQIEDVSVPSYDPHRPLTTTTVNKIRSLIKGFQLAKASGENGIHIIFLKAILPGPFAHHLATVFNILLHLQVTPAHWNHALVCMLPKDSSGLASECRPISLTTILQRIYEKVLQRW